MQNCLHCVLLWHAYLERGEAHLQACEQAVGELRTRAQITDSLPEKLDLLRLACTMREEMEKTRNYIRQELGGELLVAVPRFQRPS